MADQSFGSKYYPGEYDGVYGRLMVNTDTGEIEDELDREAIHVSAGSGGIGYPELIYTIIADEVFGVDEDYSVSRGLSYVGDGIEIYLNHWTGPNIDATLVIDDDGTRLKGAPTPFVR